VARRLFFVQEIRRGTAELAGDDARHLTRVLRVEPGQQYEISDNRSVYLAEVEFASKDRVGFRVLAPIERAEPRLRLTLLVALIKFERFEWMLEKTTELGAVAIIPVIAERCEKGLDRAAAKRLERWRRIVLESAQQSRRPRLPSVEEARRFRAALDAPADHRYLLDEEPGAPDLLHVVPPVRPPATVAALIGPEGGWTEAERVHAKASGWTAVSAGPHVLRAETAAMAAAAILMAAWNHRVSS
jgi:16S rRNA (uracil1498-N3)-methyltransferase